LVSKLAAQASPAPAGRRPLAVFWHWASGLPLLAFPPVLRLLRFPSALIRASNFRASYGSGQRGFLAVVIRLSCLAPRYSCFESYMPLFVACARSTAYHRSASAGQGRSPRYNRTGRPWATRYSRMSHQWLAARRPNHLRWCWRAKEANRAGWKLSIATCFKPVWRLFFCWRWVLIVFHASGQPAQPSGYTPGRLWPDIFPAGWGAVIWAHVPLGFHAIACQYGGMNGTGHTGCQRLLHAVTGGHAPGLASRPISALSADSISVGITFPFKYTVRHSLVPGRWRMLAA